MNQLLLSLTVLLVITTAAQAQFGGCFTNSGCTASLNGPTSSEDCCVNSVGTYVSIGGQCLQCIVVYKLVKRKEFNIFINLIVLANFLFLFIYMLIISDGDVNNRFFILNKVVAVSLVFVSIYVLEICLRIFLFGPYNYFKKLQNIIDFVVILFSLILLIFEAVSPAYSILAVFRPVKFIRLLRLKRRYRNIIDTLYVLSRRLISVGLLLLVIYYSFAITGMEFFDNTVKERCCNESLFGVGEYYNGNITDFTPKVYYLLNFDNILTSYVTLFVLMVVNNWFIVMEGFASMSPYGWLVRFYFMSFYLITLVVLQVIISFIVEAFVFRIQVTEKRKHCLKHSHEEDCHCHRDKKVAHVELHKADIDKLHYVMTYNDQTESRSSFNKWVRHRRRLNIDKKEEEKVVFTGRRLRTKDDIHLRMYRSELLDWIKEHDKKMKNQQQNKDDSKEHCAKLFCRVAWKYTKNVFFYIVE